MALVVADRVVETSSTTGTGSITLAGAVTGYQRFNAVCSVGDTCYYTIEEIDASGKASGQWECGLGTYSAANTLTRTTVQKSSNANAAVNFTATTLRAMMCTTAEYLASQLVSATGLYSGLLSSAPTKAGTTLSTVLGAGAVSADSAAGVHITGTSGCGAYTTTVPGTPYTITAMIAVNSNNTATVGGLGWTDGTKIQFMYVDTSGRITVQSNSNVTTFAATNLAAAAGGADRLRCWLRISDDGTNVSFSTSGDGVNFVVVYTVAKSAGYLGASGYSHIFVGTPGGTGAQDISVMSWKQT